MRIKLQYVIDEMNGFEADPQFIETEMDDPIFLNMQFCIEREQYYKILEVCSENKTNIHRAISDLLADPNPYKILGD